MNPNFRRFIGLAEWAAAPRLILPGLTGILPWLTPPAAVGPLVILAVALVVASGRFAVVPL